MSTLATSSCSAATSTASSTAAATSTGATGSAQPHPSAPATGVYHVPEGVIRPVILSHARDLLRQVRARYVRKTVPVDGEYRQLRAAELPEANPLGAMYDLLRADHERLAEEFDDLPDRLAPAIAALARVLDLSANATALWSAYRALLDAVADVLLLASTDPACTVTPTASGLTVRLRQARPPAQSRAEWAGPTCTPAVCEPVDLDAPTYLDWITALSAARRTTEHRPSLDQVVAEHIAFEHLTRGHRGNRPVRSYGTSGFRDHQTYMSVTDPGEGHLDGTVRDRRHLDGVIVHIEHLERGSVQDRAAVEPYRIPHPHTVARVRLLVGTDAPTSSYVGRPVFEAAVEPSMLKTAHTVAAACSALFAEGLSECKLAIEGMTARQAVQFMRAVRAAVRRDRFTQLLSAAFNLNTPILDDRTGQPHDAKLVTERLPIGLLGVALTRAGGFDKVTWDGTANTYPSTCVLEQISYADALALVHRAHEVGLLTYFSAGFRMHNLARAVYTGVDGVGVGGAQILRYMDAHTGCHGPFLAENIGKILAERNLAETSLLGRAAQALSRLDRMAYEGSINGWEDARRRQLFDALTTEPHDLDAIGQLLDTVRQVTEQPADHEHPLLCWVRRLRLAGRVSLAARAYDPAQWTYWLDRLAEAAERRDLDRLEPMLHTINSAARGAPGTAYAVAA